MPIRTLTVCGVGLIGGSFALALRKAGFQGRILGVSSPSTLTAALQLGVIDEAASPAEGIARADLIYLAQPISRIIDFLPTVAAHRQPHAIVTDAGSTKVQIMSRAAQLLPPHAVIGGHPMAGKELRGVEQAEPTLFQGRPYVLTAADAALASAEGVEFQSLLQAIGARIIFMDPERHDRTIALLSHLCQITSTALACTVSDGLAHPSDLDASGPALRDMTRVALSSYELWKDIIDTNHEPIAAAIDALILNLQSMRNQLRSQSLAAAFSCGASLASDLRNRTPAPPKS